LPAVIADDAVITHQELHDEAVKLARAMAGRGVGPGRSVWLVSENRIELSLVWRAAHLAGAVVVCGNPTFTGRDYDEILDQAPPDLAFASNGFGDARSADLLEARLGSEKVVRIDDGGLRRFVRASPSADPRPRAPEQTAMVVWTSGSSGRRKGVCFSEEAVVASVLMNEALDPGRRAKVRLITETIDCIASIAFGHLQSQALGQTAVLMNEPEPSEIWKAIRRHAVTYMSAMPTFYRQLLMSAEPADERAMAKLRPVCATGGLALSDRLARDWRRRFGVELLPGYGATEIGGAATWVRPDEKDRWLDVGAPTPGSRIRIADDDGNSVQAGQEGFIEVRSPTTMCGYADASQAGRFSRDGYFRTGDLGAMNEFGRLTIYGRHDRFIAQAGERIDPDRVEALMLECPGVSEATVVAKKDDVLGEIAVAHVRFADGAAMDRQALRRCMLQSLPADQYPLDVVLWRRPLPRTPSGKPDRQALAAMPATECSSGGLDQMPSGSRA